MDGASKFVRGDAVAGILILFINIIGGLIIGTVTHAMSLNDAATNYMLLTIGDGLVAQIPSLLLSTSAAIIVTRVSAARDMGEQVREQLLGNANAIYTVAAHGWRRWAWYRACRCPMVFLTLAVALAAVGYTLSRRKRRRKPPSETLDGGPGSHAGAAGAARVELGRRAAG
jgi:flagellar biosynthesis protein FlhA